ncbi:MAG: hypothetical protein GXO77_01435 [Calditrichaeota bacterium]|nr:hypothetical protein [Calditrichota bacterium]
MLLKLLLRQPLNAWRQLSLLNRLQLLFLVAVVYVYAITRLNPVFEALAENRLNPLDLSLVINGAFTLYFLISAPWILTRLIPKQSALSEFYMLPLSSGELLTILGYYTHKYWLPAWLLYLPIGVAVSLVNPLIGLFGALLLIALDIAAFTLTVALFYRFKNRKSFYFFSLLAAALFLLISWIFYWNRFSLLLVDLLFLTGCLIGSLFIFKRFSPSPEELYPLTAKEHQLKTPKFFSLSKSGVISVLFGKEMLNLWRNPSYRKNKLLLFTLLVLSGVAVFRFYPNRAVEVFTLILFGLIWWHYSNFFSRRYVYSEPEWYFRMLTIPFWLFVLSRFLVEFLFVLILLTGYSIILWFGGIGITEHWQLLLFLMLSSGVILLTMISFQIIFFDDPRLAGYAYHFSLIFFTVMILNYYFLGPLITVLFLLFFFYKSYRFLKR